MSPISPASMLKRTRPTSGRAVFSISTKASPKQVDKALRNLQQHGYNSVSARREKLRQDDVVRRRAVNLSAKAMKLAEMAAGPDRAARMLTYELRVSQIIKSELKKDEPKISAVMEAAEKVRRALRLPVDIKNGFVAALRRVLPGVVAVSNYLLGPEHDWDIFRAVFDHLAAENLGGRLSEGFKKLHQLMKEFHDPMDIVGLAAQQALPAFSPLSMAATLGDPAPLPVMMDWQPTDPAATAHVPAAAPPARAPETWEAQKPAGPALGGMGFQASKKPGSFGVAKQ